MTRPDLVILAMSGPDFLELYFVWFLVTFGVVLLCRWRGHDTPAVTITGLLAYEGLGAVRFVIGTIDGLHRWDFMALMMIFGGLIFFVRTKSGGSGGGWWNQGRGSGGGGCGSSGCGGGGGCGGCGGS